MAPRKQHYILVGDHPVSIEMETVAVGQLYESASEEEVAPGGIAVQLCVTVVIEVDLGSDGKTTGSSVAEFSNTRSARGGILVI